MIIAIYITLLLINFLFVVLNKNSKIIFILTVIGQAIIMCGNNMNADYLGYEYFHEIQEYPKSMEIGYVWLSKIAYDCGLDYQIFKELFLLVGLIAMGILVLSMSENVHLFALLYLSTMIFLDVVQIRQFIAFVILTYALVAHSKGKRVLFCLLTLFGSLFQITILVYLPLILLNAEKLTSKRFVKTFFIIIIIICALVFVSGSRLGFLRTIVSNFVEPDKLVYFDTRGRLGFLKYYAFHFICIYLAWVVQNYYCKHVNNANDFIRRFSESTYLCIFYSSIAMPLVMLNNNFLRFFKFGLIPLFICISCLFYDARQEYRLIKRANIPLTWKILGGRGFVLFFCIIIVLAYEIVLQEFVEAYNVLQFNTFLG